ncbi:hypothetical protein CBER1_00789 [Cercospora berteroae]|uniref:Ketoreductase domain-containing protein n=1 Tax=Cercospora berteroae TaxID=357750 RepID=A0A2S6C1W3_9PEZI|nr:hypothetical protein CBER1_00789 [Cercospora berteroae]
MALRFDDQVIIVTGAGSGLGKAYALFFASRGASVVVNDSDPSTAAQVDQQIIQAGGKAVLDTTSVEQGDKIIDTALQKFGAVHVLINNAGILRDVSFGKMTDEHHYLSCKGTYKTTQAAWKTFRKQKYGRVILTSSAAGLYGSFGQCNYSAAKSAMIGLGETLAKEGAKYNILTNIIAPIAASRMTATVMPEKLLEHLPPSWIVPLVAVLTHKANTENGSLFELGGGHMSRLRWQRSGGALLKCDETLMPSAILKRWDAVNDFSQAEYPSTVADLVSKLKESQRLPPNKPGPWATILSLARKTRSLSRGQNDAVGPKRVVEEIRKHGYGHAIPIKASAEDGELLIKTAIDAFGRIDILINNAGILRDKSFQNMNDGNWDAVYNVHLRSTYKTARAAFPYMKKQGYGRIVNTTSTSGIYGSFGQSNYAAAVSLNHKKCVSIFVNSILTATENRHSRLLQIPSPRRQKYNIRVTCISPSAGTALTRSVLPEEVAQGRKPDYVAPIVLLLCSDQLPSGVDGQIFEAGCGWQAQTRLQRSKGYDFSLKDRVASPEDVLKRWHDIVDFTSQTSIPEAASDTRMRIMANIERAGEHNVTGRPTVKL